jgi:hypothetical protein
VVERHFHVSGDAAIYGVSDEWNLARCGVGMMTDGFSPRVKFVGDLRPDYVGIPVSMARKLANQVQEFLPGHTRGRLDFDGPAGGTKWGSDLARYVSQMVLRVSNLPEDSLFIAYLADGGEIEVSAVYEAMLAGQPPNFQIVSHQVERSEKWRQLKAMVEELDLQWRLAQLWVGINDRDLAIFAQRRGLHGNPITSVADLAGNARLSRARVHQIVNAVEALCRRRILLMERKRYRASRFPERRSLRSLSEVGRFAILSGFSLEELLDYLRLVHSAEMDCLNAVIPVFRSEGDFAEFISGFFQRRSNDGWTPVRSTTLAQAPTKDVASRRDDVPLDQLELTVRTVGVLQAAGIRTVSALTALSNDELCRVPGLTRKAFSEIQEWVAQSHREIS